MILKRAALESCLSKCVSSGRSSFPRALLLYGPNEGCSRYYERRVVEALASSEGEGEQGRGTSSEGVVRLALESLTKGGKKLRDVLGSASLFGGVRIVVVEAHGSERFDARSVFADGLEALAQKSSSQKSSSKVSPSTSSDESFLVVRAGAIRKDSALCKLFEAEGATFACYEERGSDIVPMLRGLLEEGGVRADEGMLAALGEALCRDRMAAQREIEKVVLYYGEGGVVDSSVWNVLGDWREARIGEVLYAAFDGESGACLRGLERLRVSQVAGIALVRSVMRHIECLMRLSERSGGDGARLRGEIARWRPFVMFAYRDRLGEQVRRWGGDKIRGGDRLLRLLGEGLDCERRMKGVMGAGLQWVLAERYVLGVSWASRRGR